MNFGEWNVNVTVGGMPEKVATAFGKLEDLIGAEYIPIAYIGSQVVNGINHAVLAQQRIVSANPINNIVLVIFNEKPGTMEIPAIVGIERILVGGAEYGGIEINAETQINRTAQRVFDEVLGGFVGSTVTPFALLGTQVTTGTDYFYACETCPVVDNNPRKNFAIVTVNDIDRTVNFIEVL